MGVMSFDHIGIAVESIEKALGLFEGVFGFRVEETETVEAQGVRVAKLHTGKTTVELIEPLNADSPVAKFIEKRGEGIHHICFSTDDAMAAVAVARKAGFEPLTEDLKPGASGKKVIFLNPKTTFKTLIELSQGPGCR